MHDRGLGGVDLLNRLPILLSRVFAEIKLVVEFWF